MFIKNRLFCGIAVGIIVGVGLTLLAYAAIYTPSHTWISDTSKYADTTDQINVLADIQPGLGTVMVSYGRRFLATFYAAQGGNWDLANYQLKEMREDQEIAEITRPARTALLRAFEASYLGDEQNPAPGTLQAAINARDFSAFVTAITNAVNGCNGCHTGTGFSYIQIALPSNPTGLPLRFTQ